MRKRCVIRGVVECIESDPKPMFTSRLYVRPIDNLMVARLFF